jgi:hypothetical protein
VTAIAGTWDVKLRTPIGSLAVVYTFTGTAGAITGTAASRDETVPLVDVACDGTADGQHVTWRQSVTKPMRVNLDFDVTVTGDTLSGHSWAGRLPRTRVTGTRRNQLSRTPDRPAPASGSGLASTPAIMGLGGVVPDLSSTNPMIIQLRARPGVDM